MKNTTAKIALSIGLGALIGGFLIHELNLLHWTIGVIIGSLIAYFSYEFEQVTAGAKHAYKATVNWKPDWDWWKTTIQIFINSVTVATTFFFYGVFTIGYFIMDKGFTESIFNAQKELFGIFLALKFLPLNTSISIVILAYCLIPLSFLLLGLLILLVGGMVINNDVEDLSSSVLVSKKVMFFLNPISFPFTVFVWVIKNIINFIKHFSTIVFETTVELICLFIEFMFLIETLFIFLKKFILFIHTELRLICMIDCAIGIMLGHFLTHSTQATVTGAVIGIVFGIIHHYVVSIKILKLQVRV